MVCYSNNLFMYIFICPSRGLPPYFGEEVCSPQWREELCWRERKLLVEPAKTDSLKGKSQKKHSPLSSRLGVGPGTNDSTPEKIYCYESMEKSKAHTQGGSAGKEEWDIHVFICSLLNDTASNSDYIVPND
jgi:hypothetical protein